MIAVPPKLQAQFQQLLTKKGIPERYHVHFNKWLRYYYDFCHKYNHSAVKPETLALFSLKLRDKKQKRFQIAQASEAVSIFWEIVDKKLDLDSSAKRINNAKADNIEKTIISTGKNKESISFHPEISEPDNVTHGEGKTCIKNKDQKFRVSSLGGIAEISLNIENKSVRNYGNGSYEQYSPKQGNKLSTTVNQ